MTRFVRNRVVLTVTLVWLLYWPIAWALPQPIIVELVNGMVAALSVGLAIAYAPGIWTMTRRNPYHLTGADMLVLGVTMVQVSIAALFAWAWFFRYSANPEWMSNHLFRGWMVYQLMIGCVLHLIASDVGVLKNQVPARSWKHLGLITAIGIGLGVLVLSLGRA